MAVQWPLLIFSVLLGASSGVMIFLGIGEIKGSFKKVRFPLSLIALILLAVGGCASAMHLGHIDRALYILGNVGSAFSRELFAVGFTGLMTLIYVVLSRKDYPAASKVFGILAAIGGILLPLIAGASYMMPARPAWDSFALPLMYLGTGIGMGFVLSAAYVYTKGDEADKPFSMKLATIGIIASIAVTLIYVIWIAIAPFPDPTRSFMRLAGGDLAAAFWLGVVLVGMGGPIAVLVMAKKGSFVDEDNKPESGENVVAGTDASGAATATRAAAAGKISTANALWGALACLVVGSVILRVIMYVVATSVEQLIY
ncbi:MAG: dimethyl sulfoxide reductase anchor subunit [Eggerthellaceae bacterium]|nr:dimethyl sulfoxide reductase anchor subunit [Eggerthellaceae bacterium]